MTKAEALVQDLARLFAKYNLADWRIVLEQLRNGGTTHVDLAQAIEDIYKQSKQKKPTKKASPHPNRPMLTIESADPARVELLRNLYKGLTERKVAPKLTDLRETYIRSGGKDKFPLKREEAIDALIRHVAYLPEDDFENTIITLFEKGTGSGREYAEWFGMIYKPSSKP